MELDVFKKLKKELPRVKKSILLKNHTTFKIGGPAEYFLVAKTKKDLMKAITIAKKLKMPLFVLGGGSNLLVSDEGIKGLVVKLQNEEAITLGKGNIITASAGVELGKVVGFSIEKSLEGLEWAGGLPGSLGGAVRGNAGAFGGETKDSIFEVDALDSNLKLRKLSNKQCQFSYRSSIFKEKNWIVISVSLKLKKGEKKHLQEVAKSRIHYRKERHPLEYPNAGSVFKNVALKEVPLKIQQLFLDKVKEDPFPIIPTAWFIIGAGLTGKKIGQAQISKKHSNYIVNLGGATASDILALVDFVKQKVKEKYSIQLEVEVQFIGF